MSHLRHTRTKARWAMVVLGTCLLLSVSAECLGGEKALGKYSGTSKEIYVNTQEIKQQ